MQESKFIEELYTETVKAVNIYWNKYYSVRKRYEKEDIIQELMLKALRPDRYGVTLEEKYREGKVTGGLKSFCMLITSRFLTDMVRTQKNIVSVEQELADGLTILDTIADNRQSVDLAMSNLLDMIPEDEVVEALQWKDGRPVFVREIIYRTACGERTTEICTDLEFRKTDKPVPSKVSSTIVYNIIQNCRPFFDEILGEKEVKGVRRTV